MSVSVNGTNGLTFNDGSTQNTSAYGGGFAMRNRIINGAMVIDQRNAGASVTPTNGQYTLDRWQAFVSQASKITVQQNAGSVTPPAGFKSYLGVTVGASANVTVGASDYFFIQQAIEGYNTADFGFGAAGASTITFSFWVRSSVTGTYGGVLYNGGGSRSYPYSYVINSANTWEQKTVTVVGDTTGTWQTTTSAGIQLTFSLGTGSTYNGTAGAWAGANYYGTTGAVTPITTNSATFYITGVQLEKGSTATSFDYRPYGTELQLAQRYYYKMVSGNAKQFSVGTYYTASLFAATSSFPVTMRTAPSLDYTTGTGYYLIYSNNAADPFDAFGAVRASETITGFDTSTGTSGTQGYGGVMVTNNASSYIGFSAEL